MIYNILNSLNWCPNEPAGRKEETEMATDMKRFTISLTKDMEIQLDRLKQAKYYNTTKNKMIQDLICLGLESIQHKTDASGQQGTSAANGTRAEP